MKILAVLLLSLSVASIWSQFDLAWVKAFNVNSLPDLAIDSLGNSYTLLPYKPEEGVEHGMSVSDKTTTNDLTTLAKISPQGEIEWHLTIDASKEVSRGYDVRSWCIYRDISVSEDGERIAILVQYDIKDGPENRFDKKEVSGFSNRTDVQTKCFILYYSNSGKFLWKTDFNTITAWNADQHLDRITFGPNNELYLVKSYATIDFKNKPLDPNDLYQHSIGLFRFSDKGTFMEELISWEQTSTNHKNPETAHYIQQLEIKFDPNVNIYLYGLYRGNLVLSEDEVLSNYGTKYTGVTGFLVKFSNDMEFKWRYQFAGTMGGATIREINFSKEGDLYFAGDFSTNIYISRGNDLAVKTKTPPTSHSGRSLFYGKLNAKAELEFVKYHQQEKHYTNSGVSTMWLDEQGRSHIVGFYNDSLTISGCEKTLFPGMRVDTSHFTYEGKILTSYHPRYFYGLYHAVYQDDSILSLDDVFDFEKPVWPGGFFSRPIIADNSVYFTTSINEPVNAFLKNNKELKINPDSKKDCLYGEDAFRHFRLASR